MTVFNRTMHREQADYSFHSTICIRYCFPKDYIRRILSYNSLHSTNCILCCFPQDYIHRIQTESYCSLHSTICIRCCFPQDCVTSTNRKSPQGQTINLRGFREKTLTLRLFPSTTSGETPTLSTGATLA